MTFTPVRFRGSVLVDMVPVRNGAQVYESYRYKFTPVLVPVRKFRSGIDCTQPLSFLLVIERLVQARCTIARGTGVSEVDGRASSPFSARLCLALAPVSQLLWTRKERGFVRPSTGTKVIPVSCEDPPSFGNSEWCYSLK